MEIIKDVATVVGCCISVITLLSIIIKPARKKVVNWIKHTSEASETSMAIQEMNNNFQKINERFDSIETKIDKLDKSSKQTDATLIERIDTLDSRVEKLDERVLDNERDRIKAELSEYASRCARKMKIYPEEMTHINEIYYKYHEVLKCNSFGTKMYDIIIEYYENQEWLNT